MAMVADESLNGSLTFATSQMFGRWDEVRDATLSVVLPVLFHFSLLHLWRRKAAKASVNSTALAPPRANFREETFCKTVLSCEQRDDFAGAAAAFREFGEEAVQFSQAPSLLLRTLRLAKASEVSELWDLYQATKIDLDYSRPMYHALISVLCKSLDVDRAMEVLRDMILSDVEVDSSTYGSLIRAQLLQGDLESSVQLLSQMQRQQIRPDFATFQAVLEVACGRQLVVLAEELLQDMQRHGLMNSSSLATMVRLYGRQGDTGRAKQIFREMPRKFGFKVDSQGYSSMLCICASEGEISDAFQIYEEMLAAGYEADLSCFKALLSGSLQLGDLDTAARLISDAGCSTVPQQSLELFLLQAARRGRRELAMPILEEALRSGAFVSPRIVSSLRR